MASPYLHLDTSVCIWCPDGEDKIQFLVEGVANEKTGGFDVRSQDWFHVEEYGTQEQQPTKIERDHEPTPAGAGGVKW